MKKRTMKKYITRAGIKKRKFIKYWSATKIAIQYESEEYDIFMKNIMLLDFDDTLRTLGSVLSKNDI